MTGYLTQAVDILAADEKQISAISSLPGGAEGIQTEAAASISPFIARIQAMQTAVIGFVQQVTPQLNTVVEMVSGNPPLPPIKAAIDEIKSEASSLQSIVSETSAQINSSSSQILGYLGQLGSISAELMTQMNALQGQLLHAESEEESARKSYRFLLALGPFGLAAGVAVALALFVKTRSEVNGYESEVIAMNRQLKSVRALESAFQVLEADLQGVVKKISGVNNTVTFLVSDLLTVDSDLDSGSALSILAIKVRAAIAEVATLGIDAS